MHSYGLIQFEAYLPDENAIRHVHHFILYNCHYPEGYRAIQKQFEEVDMKNGYIVGEYYDTLPKENDMKLLYTSQYCTEYQYVWAVGGMVCLCLHN